MKFIILFLKNKCFRKEFIMASGMKFKCEECPKATSRKDLLLRHMRSHEELRPFQCDQCQYASRRKANLERHVMEVETIQVGKVYLFHTSKGELEQNTWRQCMKI